MRIAAFTSQRFGSSDYRVYDPLRELSARRHVIRLTLETVDTSDPVLASDVVYLHRYQDSGTQKILRRAREAGVAIVWDHDDNVAAAPEIRRGALRAQEVVWGIRAMVQLADVVTTTNELLAAHYREAGAANVCVVPNYLPRSYESARRTPTRGQLRIGWIAWADHQRDWNDLGLREICRRLLDDHPEVVIESVGPIDLGLAHERYIRTGAVEFDELVGRIAAFDVGLAIIADTPFNRGRSDIKLKEYAALGIPWLASDAGPYTGLGEGEGGLLVPADGWEAGLRRIVSEERLRKKLSKRGAKWARGQRLRDHVGEWEQAFELAIRSRAAAGVPA